MAAMHTPITIHDIAREAGVSPSTVSRVLNGTAQVADQKRKMVLEVVERYHYRPSAIARGLVNGRTAAIGVLTQSVASPFYGEIVLGIERGLANSGYHALVSSGHWQTEQELAALDLLSVQRVDAMIVLAGMIPDAELRRVASEIPLVVIGRVVTELEEYCLRIDDEQAGYAATRHLIDLGHRRIAHLAGPHSHQDAIDRQQGYLRALSDAGIACEQQLIVSGDYTEQSGFVAVQALLNSGMQFSALFAANDQMAYGARLALYRHGIAVPDDVSLVGFDDQPASAYAIPPLTTIRQPTHAMGEAAAYAVLRLLDNQPPQLATYSTELVIRDSTAQR